ncbi:two-component system sensor histidine kinase BaeS [Kitasatospora sp. GAS204A]|uniref:HAMP domain-containing sensor histidine kinase n=1 Tax=unclassified Kitasatospora TaxID=2633591 RepID=UPI002475D16D|nr:HAMP domain-containing sensor histidine kinase [Kitasatospora sp. GAS204B]MDH6120119.1 two-component system sensor histidine kinase BaeS [Kitasatospora sp. GAS204B]
MRRRVPLRKSLLVRLLAASILVAVCSVAATAWLAVNTTSQEIQQERVQTLSDDAGSYETLLGYAATHHDWDGVGPVLADLTKRTGRHIALTTQSRQPIGTPVDSGGAAAPHASPVPSNVSPVPSNVSAVPSNVSAVIDPLDVDQTLAPGGGATRIDPRAVGPFALSADELAHLRSQAGRTADCLRTRGFAAETGTDPSGRPNVTVAGLAPDDSTATACALPQLSAPTPTEQAALSRLSELVDACLSPQGLGPVKLGIGPGGVVPKPQVQNPGWSSTGSATPPGPTVAPTTTPTPLPNPSADSADQAVATCVDASRRQQLAPYVAPAALLFISDRNGTTTTAFHLTRAGILRIAGVTGLVLALTVALSVLLATRLVRPLRALTDAAQHPTEPHARVPVTGNDEIGYLAAAFNDLSERRERIEEQRKAMVSDVAHELRTPLSNIRGWLEATQDGVATPDRSLMASLLEEALLLQHIIDDLRDLAAADADSFRLHREPIRIADLLDQVAEAHRARAEAAGVLLNVLSTDGDAELVADPVRLRQAVGNLVDNAVRHTPRGGNVTVGAYPAGDELIIEVTDTGTGIGPDELPHVFDRFWRAEKSRSRQTGGSGLGLAIVRQLAHAHGGTVTATSRPGHGAVFTLRLPRTDGTDGG